MFKALLCRDKICGYDEHPLAGRDIQYRAHNTEHTIAGRDVQHHLTILKYNVHHVKQSWIIKILVIKNVKAFR